jgi:ketosteroid isomerase-like protein
MRRVQMLVLGATVVALGLALGVKGSDVKQELTEIKKQWSEAELKRDTKFLDKLFADDFVVGTSQGQVLNKQQMLELLRNPDRQFTELQSDKIDVRVYGNVAVMTDRTTIRGTDKGKPFGGVFRYVRIFVREQGRWRAVLAQATPLKLESAASK